MTGRGEMIDRRVVHRSSVLIAVSTAELKRLRIEIHRTSEAVERFRTEIDATWRMLLELGRVYRRRNGRELNTPIGREN